MHPIKRTGSILRVLILDHCNVLEAEHFSISVVECTALAVKQAVRSHIRAV